MSEFVEFPKIARLSREIIVTEKIDGTNACIKIEDKPENCVFDASVIAETGDTPPVWMHAGSRTRWITTQNDNFGFAKWVADHAAELFLGLGFGTHFGEWWGQGIQRGYGLTEKRFSLFNTSRWTLHGTEPQRIVTQDPRIEKYQDVLPACCGLVPVLYRGEFDTAAIQGRLDVLRYDGSVAAPGFMQPEGIVVFHPQGNVMFKKTIEKDEQPKGASR